MKFIVSKDRKGEFRWTLYASNGRKIAVSGEGYKRRSHANKMIRRIILYIDKAKIEDI